MSEPDHDKARPTEQFFPGTDTAGDPIGYVRGHVTREECIAAMLTQGWGEDEYAEDCEVWHGWIRKIPAEATEWGMRWQPASGPGRGAFAVTMWLPMKGRAKWRPEWTDAPLKGENDDGE